MSTDYERYLSTLFREDEFVCMADSAQGTNVQPLFTAIAGSSRQFVSVNPLIGDRDNFPYEAYHSADKPRRADVNVSEHRNFLFEFDAGTIEEQLSEIANKRVPYASLVFSGSKSVHCVIALEEAVSRADYDRMWRQAHYVLWRGDKTAKNPSRLTRVGGAVRDNGVLQELIDLQKPITLDKFERWLGTFSAHIMRCEAKEAEQLASRADWVHGGGMESVDPRTLAFLSGDLSTKSSRHGRLVAAAFELQEAGVAYEEVLRLVEQAADLHGITADPKRLNEGVQIVNYVFSRSSRKKS